jgi:esterase/lipase
MGLGMFSSLKAFVLAWNIPGWGIFLLCTVTLIKTWPIIQKNLLDARANADQRASKERDSIADYYRHEIEMLRDEVRQCRESCEKQEAALLNKIDDLNETIHGMRRQHIQEQISLISAVIQSIGADHPLLKQLLLSFETVQRALPHGPLGNVEGDTAHQTP